MSGAGYVKHWRKQHIEVPLQYPVVLPSKAILNIVKQSGIISRAVINTIKEERSS